MADVSVEVLVQTCPSIVLEHLPGWLQTWVQPTIEAETKLLLGMCSDDIPV
jgi:hypothetical protein